MDSEDEWLDVPEQEPGTTIEGDEAILEGDEPEPTITSSEDHLVIPFAPSASEGTKTRRVPSKQEREEKMNLHKAHLLLWFVHGRIRNRWANHQALKAELRRIVSPEIARLFEGSSAPRPPVTLSSLKTLVAWWKKTFSSEKSGSEEPGKLDLASGDSSGPDLLLTFAKHRRGPSSGIVLLFVSLCRALGLLTRLVVSLQPVSFRFTVEELSKEPSSSSQPPENQPNKRQKTSDLKDASAQRTESLYWCEVYSTDEARWISIDPEQSKVDDPYSLEPPLGSSCPLRYVVGFQEDQMAKDVTRRYSGHWGARTKRLRMPEIFWWTNVLERFHPRLGPNADRNRDDWEDAELEAREKTEILPKTFDEFKRHPLYALERHLKKTEALKSTGIVLGHFRGEKVFPRSEVKTLRSSLAWMKLARDIIPGESPAKLVKSRSMSKGKKDDDSPSNSTPTQQETPLYGFWQTRPYSTQAAKNGIVPKNQYGRVDLYQESMLPEGTVHLTYPNAKELARRFEIDYAEAVVSFEFTRGRMVPKVDGIVVCQENEEILREACVEKTQIKQEKERKTKEQEALARWKKLTQGLLLRERLMRKYDLTHASKQKSE